MTLKVIYAEQRPDVYLKSTIYDPSDGMDPSESGKIIPAVGSLVIDLSTYPALSYALYTVDSVDDDYRSHLTPVSSMMDNSLMGNKLLTYGNDQFMLYFDTRVTPTRLKISSNLMILGENAVNYILYKADGEGNDVPISMYRNAAGDVVGNLVPITSIPDCTNSVSGVRVPNSCETNYQLTSGDIIKMKVYDSAGIELMEVKLITARAGILDSLAYRNNIITEFWAEANQQDGNGNFVVFVGQSPEDLAIYPKIRFDTNEERAISIGDPNFAIQGFNDIKSDIPGAIYTVNLKYRLDRTIQQGVDSGTEFLNKQYQVIIMEGTNSGFLSKVSVMPKYNTATSQWTLAFTGYYKSRDIVRDVTSYIEFIDNTSFDGTSSDWQKLSFKIPAGCSVNPTTIDYVQTMYIKVDTAEPYEKLLLKDTEDAILIYGEHGLNHSRPVMYYDAQDEKYTFSQTLYPTVDKFLETFFLNANPPWNLPKESISPRPTHFMIRSLDTNVIMSPVPIEEYVSVEHLTQNSNGFFNNSTVLVEFLYENTNDTMSILYGVPCLVEPKP